MRGSLNEENNNKRTHLLDGHRSECNEMQVRMCLFESEWEDSIKRHTCLDVYQGDAEIITI